MSSFEPKKEQKYFCISALASKMGQVLKMMSHVMLISDFFILEYNDLHSFFDQTYFREVGQKYRNIFIRFLVQMKASKSHSEINFHLGHTKLG